MENAVKLTYKDIFTVIEPLHCPDLRSLNVAIRSALEKHNNKNLDRRNYSRRSYLAFVEKLRQMRLFGMHDAFKTSLENTIKEKMTQDKFVLHLVHSEWDNRKNRAVERAVRAAQFRYDATLDDVDYTFERGLDRNQVEWLAAMELTLFFSFSLGQSSKLVGSHLCVGSYATTRTSSLPDPQERARVTLRRHSGIKPVKTDSG